MPRLLLVTLICIAIILPAPRTAGAAEAAPRSLAPGEVQAAFQSAGYLVGEPAPWSDGISLLSVQHPAAAPADRPLLRVFVFVNADTAVAEQRLAHARDEGRRNRQIAVSDDRGPQLLAGYGVSAWRRNVALVQASPIDDVGAYPVEPDCAPAPVITDATGLELASRDFLLPTTGVDPRFVEILESLPS